MNRRIINYFHKIKQDFLHFDRNNTDEKKVLESNYFSSYKEKLVIRTNMKRSGSFGILFVSRKLNSCKTPEDIVRHEYGHAIQLNELGLIKYTFYIGIPSFFQWGDGRYYDKPWEVTADLYGKVLSRKHEELTIEKGIQYLNEVRNNRVLKILRKYKSS